MHGARTFACLALLAAAAIASAPALAETPKVWTKEDLERMFGPSDPSLRPLVQPGDPAAEQAFVEAFLERQYRLIADERERELRREELRSRYAPEEPEYSLGYAPWVGAGWWNPRGHTAGPGGPHRPPHHAAPRPRHPSAWKANPVGRPTTRSARAANPASRR